MSDVMLQLGNYRFGITTAAYQALRRVTNWRWPGQQRVGQRDALQYTGPAEDTITLDGVIYPQFRGGTGQLDAMRAEADKGVPLLLVDGLGGIHGRFVIERIEEAHTAFFRAGVPKRQEFSMTLQRYGDGV
jgi:uncharacterized protein